jgi:hypothetical protein
MKKAIYLNRPNGSPSAGGTYVADYDQTSSTSDLWWKFNDTVYLIP